jgi:hypothetical protein
METCECGNELEYFGNEWAKYCMSDCEEIIDIYECGKCKRMYDKREGNFELEERDLD